MKQKIGTIFLQAAQVIFVMMLLSLSVTGVYLVLNLESRPATYQHDNKPACECVKEAK